MIATPNTNTTIRSTETVLLKTALDFTIIVYVTDLDLKKNTGDMRPNI